MAAHSSGCRFCKTISSPQFLLVALALFIIYFAIW